MSQRIPTRIVSVLAGALFISAAALPFTAAAAAALPHDQTRPRIMAEAFQQSEAKKLTPTAAPFTPRPLAGAASRPLREVFGYVNAGNLGSPSVGYATWNFSLISTVAYFGIAVDYNGNLVHGDTGWNVWNSSTGSGLI